MTTTTFTADVDPKMLTQAEEVLADQGITFTDAIVQMMTYIAVEGRMPYFECFDPNQETLRAIAEADAGNLITVGSISDLMSELNEDD
jgi:addiction module RelB/DinJ family antitoxin